MKTTEYNLEYFIAKFEAIPEDKWTDSGQYEDEYGCKCAYGHCGIDEISPNHTEESRALSLITKVITSVNDNVSGIYSKFGSTPKQRVVNYLKSLR